MQKQVLGCRGQRRTGKDTQEADREVRPHTAPDPLREPQCASARFLLSLFTVSSAYLSPLCPKALSRQEALIPSWPSSPADGLTSLLPLPCFGCKVSASLLEASSEILMLPPASRKNKSHSQTRGLTGNMSAVRGTLWPWHHFYHPQGRGRTRGGSLTCSGLVRLAA